MTECFLKERKKEVGSAGGHRWVEWYCATGCRGLIFFFEG